MIGLVLGLGELRRFVAGGIIEEVKQRLFIGLAWQPRMGLVSYRRSAPRSRIWQRLTGLGRTL